MHKLTFAIKLDQGLLERVKAFCGEHGIKYSFFVEKAIEERLEKEELKEDMLDLKQLRGQEKESISYEEYMRKFNV